MITSWKEIAPVPSSQEFIDIVLSRTQRRLPTQIRAGFKISRIRAFYIRKVKYTAETFAEKFQAILTGFPRLADLHPFHRDLLNTLYDADHLKISLGQISTAKNLVENVAKDYVRLLKYGQSLYQCKQLKRAALGRMATICKRLKDALTYLEQVRQHLGRLPSIDPNTRTLLICGYPNVGKSSFLRAISRADVDVQPYAFTTKSLYVGHFDYKLLRFQAIDTPGILDHSIEEMNAIEMQSITAIAHLQSAVLYFMDVSEQCGFSIAAQIQLFKNIKLLFSNKFVFIVINKIDVKKLDDLSDELRADIHALLRPGQVELMQLSCETSEGVMNVRNATCDRLLAERTAKRLKMGQNNAGQATGRLAELMKRIHVAHPLGGTTIEPFVPEAVKNRVKYDKSDPNRIKLERDIEAENGGPGVYNVNLRKHWELDNESWRYDKIPEVYQGKNVYDYVDPDIEAKLKALEEEEEKLEKSGFYDNELEVDEDDPEVADIRFKAELIREKRILIRNEARLRKSLKNKAIIPRPARTKSINEMEKHFETLGVDITDVSSRLRERSRSRGRSTTRRNTSEYDNNDDADPMDIDDAQDHIQRKQTSTSRNRSQSRAVSSSREWGIPVNETERKKAIKLAKLGQGYTNRMARQGESDRWMTASLTKHLVAGKRGIGKNQRR